MQVASCNSIDANDYAKSSESLKGFIEFHEWILTSLTSFQFQIDREVVKRGQIKQSCNTGPGLPNLFPATPGFL